MKFIPGLFGFFSSVDLFLGSLVVAVHLEHYRVMVDICVEGVLIDLQMWDIYMFWDEEVVQDSPL